jgi:hypothetical protein
MVAGINVFGQEFDVGAAIAAHGKAASGKPDPLLSYASILISAQ